MTEQFELYFTDLTEQAQKELLEKEGIKTPAEMNWDINPIITFTLPECE